MPPKRHANRPPPPPPPPVHRHGPREPDMNEFEEAPHKHPHRLPHEQIKELEDRVEALETQVHALLHHLGLDESRFQ